VRLLTADDILDFHRGRADVLVLTEAGEYTTLDHSDLTNPEADAYSTAATHDGTEVTVLLQRSTIDDGEWFEDALDSDGNLRPEIAADMASAINNDAGLHVRIAVSEVRETTAAWENVTTEADALALKRAARVANLARLAGSQAAAARLLSLDQSTVNKLVRKAPIAAVLGPIPAAAPILTTTSHDDPVDPRTAGINPATQWWADACHRPRLRNARVVITPPGAQPGGDFLTLTLPADDIKDTEAAARYALDIARQLIQLATDTDDDAPMARLKELLSSDGPMGGQSRAAWHQVLGWLNDMRAGNWRELLPLEL
jgi:hypothetical protein